MILPFGVNKKCKLEARMNLISIFVKTTEPNKGIHITRAAYLRQKVGMFHGMKSVYHILMNCLLLQDQLIIWPIYFLFFSWLLSRLHSNRPIVILTLADKWHFNFSDLIQWFA